MVSYMIGLGVNEITFLGKKCDFQQIFLEIEITSIYIFLNIFYDSQDIALKLS